jgi:hypothetical protein
MADHFPFFWQTLVAPPSNTVLGAQEYVATAPSKVDSNWTTPRGMLSGIPQLAEIFIIITIQNSEVNNV